MKNPKPAAIFSGIIALFLFAFPTLAQHTIAVKLRENSDVYIKWVTDGRTGGIDAIRRLFGTHTTKPLVSDATLKAIRKHEQAQNLRKTDASLGDNVKRLCAIDFPSGMDITLISSKLRDAKFVEYAEILPERRFFADIPNDTYIDKLYQLPLVHAFEAWELVDTSAAPLLLAIVDTGVDYLHEDLSPVMYVNTGEDGLDAQGRNKRSNGIDDDNNGYIDDWHGWDFVSSASPETGDNDPMPGNPHGTHVAGIAGAAVNNGIGVAGAAINVRLLPVKIGNDAGSNSVSNSYNGLLYAAAAGAKVINCSWGGSAGSESESEIVLAAQKLGAVIVAAAGNDGSNTAFYPAAYPGVISVAATDESDQKANFSNFHGTVDICAPGKSIYSTLPSNEYGYNSGTSMASPVCAGLAALVRQKFPEYTPEQVGARIKASADDIDSLNKGFKGKLGSGRVNFLHALTKTNLKWAEMISAHITEEKPDGIFSPNELITVSISIRNLLSPLTDARISIVAPTLLGLKASPEEIRIGAVASGAEITPEKTFSFVIPADIPPNYPLEWTVNINDSDMNSYGYFSLTANPTYRTMNANNISVTFNSRGNIAYNDYPANLQGNGFRFKNGANLLYEGSLIVGTSAEKLSDVARSSNQGVQDVSFNASEIFTTQKPGNISQMDGSTAYADSGNIDEAGVKVEQHCYQFTGDGRDNFVITAYDITNTTNAPMTNLHVGLYFDWDIGAGGSDNIAIFDGKEGFGYAFNATDSTTPYTAVALLTEQPINFFAIDNDGTTADNPGVYDGFTRSEKWKMISSGLARIASSQTDISMVIAAGPIALDAGGTTRIAFAIGAAPNLSELKNGVREIRKVAKEFNIGSGFHFNPLPDVPTLMNLYPAIINNNCQVEFYLPKTIDNVELTVYDAIGKEIGSQYLGKFNMGNHRVSFDVSKFSQGSYFLRLYADGARNALPFVIIR